MQERPPELPPPTPGWYDPTGRFKTEREFLEYELGLAPPEPSMTAWEVLTAPRRLGAQFGRETAELLAGPELDILGQMPMLERLQPSTYAELGAQALRRLPEEFREPRPPEELEAAWAERYQPFPGVKGAMEIALDPMAWLEMKMAEPAVTAGVRLGVKLAAPVVRRMYQSGVNALGRKVMQAGADAFGDDFVIATQPIQKALVERRISREEGVRQTWDALTKMRREFMPPRAPTEPASTRLRQLAQATRGGPGPEDLPQLFDDIAKRYDDLAARKDELMVLREARKDLGIVRPKWATGYADEELMRIAKQEGVSPFDPDWGDAIDSTVRKQLERMKPRAPIPSQTEIASELTHVNGELRALNEEFDKLVAGEPEAVAQEPTAALQASMGIGEKAAQGEIFAEYGRGAAPEVQPELIAKEPLEVKAAREAEIARGQAEMAAAKEPWELTRAELGAQQHQQMIAELEADIAAGTADPTAPQALADLRVGPPEIEALVDKVWHKGVIRTALREGKPIPPEVLKDYPDLAPKAAEVAPPEAPPTIPPEVPAEPPIPPEVPPTPPTEVVAPVAQAPTDYTADVLTDPPSVQTELVTPDTIEAAELERNIVKAAQQDVDAYDAAKIAINKAAADSGLPPPKDPPAIASHGGAGDDNPPGTFSEMIFGFPGEANERAALRKWAGSRDTLALETQQWWEQGQDALKGLGIGTRRGQAQICTKAEMSGLFKALHGEGDVPENLRPIYDTIKKLLDQETSDMIAMDPTFQRFLMAHPDYFPRGWRAPKVSPTQRARLGAKPGFLKPRVDATFSQMLEAGWEPISWNPYDMLALRRISGIEYRENMLLVQRFKTWGKIAPATEAPPDWRVPRVGPAFEGRPFAMKDGKVGFTPRLAVPDNIADALEGVYGFRPSMRLGGVDLVPWVRRVSNAPKRAKLFASLFQHVDFATRAGGVAFTPTGIMRGLPLKYPNLINRLMNVSLRKTPRKALRARMLSADPLFKDFDISLRMIAEEGWQIGGDPSMLRRTMLSSLNEAVRDVPEGAEKGLVRNAAGRLKNVARFFEDGLFDGVYRETQAWALENFIVPRLRKMHPDWDARQIAGAAAQETNIMFSSLGEWQTVFSHPAMKELSRAFIFSTNETEGWIRGAIGTLKGPNKRLWREYALGMLLFFGAVGSAINILSTGKPMPMSSLLPISWNNPYSYMPGGISYNTRFMSPQLPWNGKDGRPLYLDTVGQADTFLRWILDPPGAVMARTNVIPRMIINQIKGETFFGTPLRGGLERFKAALVDLGLPISASSGLGGLAEAVPGLKGILPELGEPRLGVPGGFVQATGLNLRAGTNQEVRDAVARGSGLRDSKGKPVERWDDLTPAQQVAVRDQYPEITAMERESKERFAERGVIDLSRDIKAGQQVQGMLDKDLQKALDSANEDVGPLSHSLTIPGTGGQRYYLNDDQFKNLQQATAKAIDELAKKAMATSTWKSASPQQQGAILDKVIKDGRAAGRAEIFKTVSGAPAPTPAKMLPSEALKQLGVSP